MEKHHGIKARLVLLPTVLGSTAIYTNRVVLGKGRSAVSEEKVWPNHVVIPLDMIMDVPEKIRDLFLKSGWADVLASLSAYLDYQMIGSYNDGLDRVGSWQEALVTIEWLKDKLQTQPGPFPHSKETTQKLAELIYNYGLSVRQAGTNRHRIGVEHDFFRHYSELVADAEKPPTHGAMVAVGMVLAFEAYYVMRTEDREQWGDWPKSARCFFEP